MENQNLLAIITYGDKDNYQFRQFLTSLPAGTLLVNNSIGYVGSLDDNIQSFSKENQRQFLIFSAESYPDLDTTYFSSRLGVGLKAIPNEAKLVVRYTLNQFPTYPSTNIMYKGGIEEIIDRYKGLVKGSTDHVSITQLEDLLWKQITESDDVRSILVYKSLFGKERIRSFWMALGVETGDRRYLLRTTSSIGPYNAKLDLKNRHK
jgi:hypothetical protein